MPCTWMGSMPIEQSRSFDLFLLDLFMMNIIIWNCRGVGRKSFPDLIRDLKIKYDTCFIILLETHVSGCRVEEIIKKMGFDNSFVSEAQGHSGGIWCLWNKDGWPVDVGYSNRQLVHLTVKWRNEGPWFLTAVYGSPHRALRQSLWDELREISYEVTGPWCAIGDFNAILKATEKEGGSATSGSNACHDFQSCLTECGLDDLGFQGSPFTWYIGDLKERLDRAMVNIQWRVHFEEASIFHLPYFKSDHVSLWLCFKQQVGRNIGQRPFRFVASWMIHEDFPGLVQRSWKSGEDWNMTISSLTPG